jgi:hypothetical protein
MAVDDVLGSVPSLVYLIIKPGGVDERVKSKLFSKKPRSGSKCKITAAES